jgi:TetR/AcrR family transcriptional regulator
LAIRLNIPLVKGLFMSTREKIVQAADRLFGEVGFDASTVQKIADLSQTNKALIHYYFKNKEGLFVCVIDHYFEELTDVLQKSLLGEGFLENRITKAVDRYIQFLEQNRNFVRIIQREINGGKQRDCVIGHMAPLFQMVVNTVREAYPRTRTGDLAAEQLVVSCYGMIITYFACQGIIEKVLADNPLTKENLQVRRKHLKEMFAIITKAIKENGQNSVAPIQGSPEEDPGGRV